MMMRSKRSRWLMAASSGEFAPRHLEPLDEIGGG
jgi:hypothetical protein